ncbi:DUF3488 and transglutaminase-like domain-containing protein [Kitasatospora sp. MAP5-34]|uniref:transglutaminase family protein n=1 Tax=Kitasatospora sp. MAP5-34 TaxID=3035102 RepID=UPI002475C72D|nr:DUF3488 and transglutaminase-like domain-containing protein [Kitasatospora sp. MAP5-34]MDH6579979.1 transglutaminase-like putative cysteine protease/uncharacterized membrane protein YhaH (DUF805 family) [Kitasatospora sp. MAP5-34]
MTTRAKLTLYSALATALGALGLTPLVTPNYWVFLAIVQIFVAAGAGAGLRRLALPRLLVVPLQLVVVCYTLLLTSVGDAMPFGLVPGARALDEVNNLLTAGGSDIQQYASPAPAHPGIQLILISSVALVAVLVDALAVTFRQAAAAGLPLLAMYSVGTGLSGGSEAWLWFLLAASGFLLLLFAEGQDRLSRWGRVFHGAGTQGTPNALSHSGHRIGLVALVCALIVPVFVPQGDLGLLSSGGNGDGTGGRGGSVTSLNPVVALTANLNRPNAVDLFSYTTDSADPSQMYLRIAALDSFDGVQWKASEQHLQNVPKQLPTPEGLSATVPSTTVNTDVRISDDLSSEWLPLPYPADRVQVPGDWRFEAESRALIGDNGQKTNGLSYHVDSRNLQPTADQLRLATTPPPDILQKYTKLPGDLPKVVAETAKQVTAGKDTPYDQAVALQNWFTGGSFTYSLKVDAGTGNDAIVKFLRDKTGFCVHFAATMAAMARTLGIPARVAIGFAPGADKGGGQFIERSEDYHAWPELFFPGTGWLRFEPTPLRGSEPSYTRGDIAPTPSAGASRPTSEPSTGASAGPSASSACVGPGHRIGDCGTDAPVAVTVPHRTPWWLSWAALASFGTVLLLLALLAAPMLWRVRLRRRRLGVGRHLPGAPPGGGSSELTDAQVLAAWDELIDSAWDLGIPPDEAGTPRLTARRIAENGRLDATATAAAGRVALATEQVLYARGPLPHPPLGPDVRTTTAGLRAAAGLRGRARAVLLPASSARVWWRLTDRVMTFRENLRTRAARAGGALRAKLRRPAGRSKPEQP